MKEVITIFILNQDDSLSMDKLKEFINKWNTEYLPDLHNLKQYYLGKHSILQRKMTDTAKPNNKIVINYPQLICDSFSSYLVGKPIVYSGDDEINTILDYNDIADLDLSTATNSNIYGYALNQLYLDENKNVRMANISPEDCFLIYDDTVQHDIMYAIKVFTANDKDYTVEVWDKSNCISYRTDNSFSSFTPISSVPHYFKDVPFIEFINNNDRLSSFETIKSLVDGLEILCSDEVNDYSAFVDAYLILKNVQADNEDIAKMKENRVLLIDDTSSAEYLTKDVNVSQIQELKADFIKNIHKISCVPDMSDENFANNSSGVAIRYKLLNFENATATKERKFKKGLQRRIELINNILGILNEKDYLDVKFTFTRNLPVNEVEISNMVNTLRGLVSDETLISQLPFIDNAEDEIKKVDKQKSDTASMYGFDNTDNESD